MAEEKKKLVKVRALTPLAGEPYLLPYDIGTEFEIDELQAAHLVEVERAEYVKSPKKEKAAPDANPAPAPETATDKKAESAEKR